MLAAAALRCIGGQMQCRLVLDTEEKRERAAKMGIKDPRKKYQIEDMVRGDCVFAATGVTDGPLLEGVKFGDGMIETETVVMRSGHRHSPLESGPSTAAAGEVLVRRVGLRIGVYADGAEAYLYSASSSRWCIEYTRVSRVGLHRAIFLGVERSATGRAWRDRLDERGAARSLAIVQRHGVPELLARIVPAVISRSMRSRPISIRQ